MDTNETCNEVGCDENPICRGYCEKHHEQQCCQHLNTPSWGWDGVVCIDCGATV